VTLVAAETVTRPRPVTPERGGSFWERVWTSVSTLFSRVYEALAA
jgi:hypothetical protein